MPTVLFLGSNPADTTRLELGEEFRAIEQRLDAVPGGSPLRLASEWAVRADDLSAHLRRHRPAAVHFGGHGDTESRILLQDAQNKAFAVPKDALSDLFGLLAGDLRCVVLSACFSADQAEGIARHVDCVVGMAGAVSDAAAIAFAAAFYEALGAGESVRKAFDLGCNAIALGALPGALAPQLVHREGVDPDDVRLDAGDRDGLLDPGISPLPATRSRAALLNARAQVVPFLGRAALLADVLGWCDAPAPVRARLFHAAGGMGKTRLFIELGKQLRGRGRRAGFLRRGATPERLAELAASERPALVVIDYAECRPDLVELLEPIARLRAEGGPGRLRLVLLARNAGDWWADLLQREGAVKDLLGDHVPVELGPFAPAGAERDEAFRKAVARFAAELGEAAPSAPPPALEDPRYDRALYVGMAALAAVGGQPVLAETLMADTLDHEERFWIDAFAPRPALEERLLRARIRRVVAALTLTGGAPRPAQAGALVERVTGARDEALALVLHDLYAGGAEHGGPPPYLGRPDLIGEAMVLRALAKEGGEAGAFLDQVFAGGDAGALRTGFEVLGRVSGAVSEDGMNDAEAWIARVLAGDVAGRAMPAFQAAKAVGDETAHARIGPVLARALEGSGTVDLVEQMAEAGVPRQTVSLREVALWAAKERLAHVAEGDAARRAELLNDLGRRQSALGQREEALASLRDAAGIRRRLAEALPDAFLPALAASLDDLGEMERDLGEREAALASIEEAVTIFRGLARQRPDAFQRELAGSLGDLCLARGELGQHEAALAAALEATAILRRLAEQSPEAILPDLAAGLTNLGWSQSKLGHHEPALAATLEAVTRYRELSTARPDAFLPDLAATLSNLGQMESELGQREEALASLGEAVTIFRKLAEARPGAFLPDLAMSLNNLGLRRRDLGQREAALASLGEAVAIFRKLATARPDAFQRSLAASLENLCLAQGELGQREEALASTLEAVPILRALAQRLPDAFLPSLAVGLANLGWIQSKLGHHEPALAATLEAVTRYRELSTARPDAFLPDLATNLHNLGLRQHEVGQREAALASLEEAVAIRRQLVEARPDAFLPALAGALADLGSLHGELGQADAALASTREAVDTLWPFFLKQPQALARPMARGLRNLRGYAGALGASAPPELVQRIADFEAKAGVSLADA
jgi:hypothetical protein